MGVLRGHAGRLSFPLSESVSLVTSQLPDCYTLEEYAMPPASEPAQQLTRVPCVAADSEVTAHSVAASVCVLPLPSSEGPARAGENIETGAAPRGCLWASGCIPRRDHMF